MTVSGYCNNFRIICSDGRHAETYGHKGMEEMISVASQYENGTTFEIQNTHKTWRGEQIRNV